MAQIFHPSSTVISKASIVVVIVALAAVAWAANEIYLSGYTTEQNVAREQPVPFSHKHHVNDEGLSCAYCHTSADKSSFAGIPPTYTCMTCHSQIWTTSPMLEPVRESFRTQKPLQWIRVHDLPDFVYFNHSIHISKGIGCETCHGRVDQMPLMRRQNTLFMAWCIDCHRAPEKYIRPRSEVFTMGYVYPNNQEEVGKKLVKEYNVQVHRITDCSTCHR
ncbi:MAG: cytochrome c3 family protein [Bacteroidota bacterium]|nr:cytochrome c3 family protein [Bacteroidota bacterium]